MEKTLHRTNLNCRQFFHTFVNIFSSSKLEKIESNQLGNKSSYLFANAFTLNAQDKKIVFDHKKKEVFSQNTIQSPFIQPSTMHIGS